MTDETAPDAAWPAEWLPARRRRTAWHEAGHALAARLLGIPVDHVSILPGGHDGAREAFWGIASPDKGPMPADIGRSGIGTLEQPPELRDYFERGIVVALAGSIGALFSGPIESYHDTPDDDFDGRAALALARRSDRIREIRVAAESTSIDPDDETALKLSAVLNSPDMTPTMTTYAHVGWLRSETRDLLERHGEQLAALAAALNEAVEMTGPEVDGILRAGPRWSCHTWPEETA